MQRDRFSYASNLERATGYRAWRSPFWPPARDYSISCLDVACRTPALGASFAAEMESLRGLIDAEWHRHKTLGAVHKTRLHDAAAVAASLRSVAELLPAAADQQALRLRADAVEHGYDDRGLSALAELDEEIAFVAGKISTWYGKQTGGLPTAFGCLRDPAASAAVRAARDRLRDVAEHVRGMHVELRLGEVPAFAATQLFFMAGEGNRHPKHIAYFLPEDEGVKYSRRKKTYYFVNTHRALLESVSLPLARRFLDLGRPLVPALASLEPIPTLGVLAHEWGHCVHRETAGFADLNAADRWVSVVLQETAADVFGILVVAEVLAPALGLSPADVVGYHLAECLRYVDRGLGFFPDSDGMYLQLNYLTAFGALGLHGEAAPRLVGHPQAVIAGFRSLARVLADTLLAGNVERCIALHRAYGPSHTDSLKPLLVALAAAPQKSVEYLQERALLESREVSEPRSIHEKA